MENLTTAADESLEVEIQSVQAIFPDAIIPNSNNQILVNCANGVQLKIHLLSGYPNIFPHFELFAPSIRSETKRKLLVKLEKCTQENEGEPMLYPLIELAMEEFSEIRKVEVELRRGRVIEHDHNQLDKVGMEDGASYPVAFHSGQPIEDRKSVFQAHVAKLLSKEQIPELLAQLKAVGKIARARHNPYAWRLVLPAKSGENGGGKETIGPYPHQIDQHDCDDDGEEGSSTKLMRMLIQMDVCGVLVVVSRWKGGGKIGSDRFRHICNAARNVLISGGFVKDKNPV